MIRQGLYEQLINKLVSTKLEELGRESYFISETSIDKNEAARIISNYLCDVIKIALNMYSGEKSIENQITLANKLIQLLINEFNEAEFDSDIISDEAKILSAVFSKIDAPFSNFEKHLKQITPYTRLS